MYLACSRLHYFTCVTQGGGIKYNGTDESRNGCVLFYESSQEEIFIKRFNWKVRFQNPTFWSHIVISFFVPIFTNYGWQWSQMTSWPRLLDVIQQAFTNPVVVVAILVSVWNCIVDPTTKGVCDRAKYTQSSDTTGLEAAFAFSGADVDTACNVPAVEAAPAAPAAAVAPEPAAVRQQAE